MRIQELGVEVAAGGLLWRDSEGREELAIVHGTRHDDWSLPKGTFDPEFDESWVDTAVREVQEETRCEFTVGELADCISYVVDGNPKGVLFWNMYLTEDEESKVELSGETDELVWVSVPEAMELIDYPDQWTLVAQAVGRPPSIDWQGEPIRRHLWRRLVSWSLWPRGASHGRLSSLLGPYRTELVHLIARVEREQGHRKSMPLPWAEAACSLLEETSVALDENDTDRAWWCFLAANRLELFGLEYTALDTILDGPILLYSGQALVEVLVGERGVEGDHFELILRRLRRLLRYPPPSEPMGGVCLSCARGAVEYELLGFREFSFDRRSIVGWLVDGPEAGFALGKRRLLQETAHPHRVEVEAAHVGPLPQI